MIRPNFITDYRIFSIDMMKSFSGIQNLKKNTGQLLRCILQLGSRTKDEINQQCTSQEQLILEQIRSTSSARFMLVSMEI